MKKYYRHGYYNEITQHVSDRTSKHMHHAKILSLLLCTVMIMCGTCACSHNTSTAGHAKDSQAEESLPDLAVPDNDAEENTSQTENIPSGNEASESEFSLDSVPEYLNALKPYVVVNNNIPFFTSNEMTNISFEKYSELDSLGRCGPAFACVGKDLMPSTKRESIGSVKPTGWQTVKYDNVDGKYLYNRCHLIGYQLTAENANPHNLITGTRYLNVTGMLPFENMLADYIVETGNHVMYRVTPVFRGDDLLAAGVLMEAKSVEDGEIEICVFCYNVQPGIGIDYRTGRSWISAEGVSEVGTSDKTAGQQETSPSSGQETGSPSSSVTYILNTSSMKFHLPSCGSVDTISPENRQDCTYSRDELLKQGYSPCGHCHP